MDDIDDMSKVIAANVQRVAEQLAVFPLIDNMTLRWDLERIEDGDRVILRLRRFRYEPVIFFDEED